MSLISKFATRNYLARLSCLNRPEFAILLRNVKLKPTPYRQPPKENHDERNMRIGRPQSPHLTIYAPELPSMLSITHRLTGMALSGYTILWGFAALTLPNPISYYIDALEAMHPNATVMFILKFIFAFPLCYHGCNGIRHLIWDLGLFLSMKGVYNSAYVMLTCAGTLTILFSSL